MRPAPRPSFPRFRRSMSDWQGGGEAQGEPRQHPLRHLGRDEPATQHGGELGALDGRPAGRGLRHDRDVAGRRRQPVRPLAGAGTVGVPFPSTEIRVVDPETPTSTGASARRASCCCAAAGVQRGTGNRPRGDGWGRCADGGWLRTGDIVEVSADGFITIVDRMKELIITGGFNVAPTEVEEALLGRTRVRRRCGRRRAAGAGRR